MVEFITMAPTSGDGKYVGVSKQEKAKDGTSWKDMDESGDREPSFDYIKSIAEAAERGGFTTLLLPTGEACLDSLAVASNLINHTSKLKFLFAVRPGSISPSAFAKQFATVHYWSGGRALVNVVTGGSPQELASQGDHLDHGARYRRTREYIQVLKKYFSEPSFTHEGEFYQLQNASLFPRLGEIPPIFFGGASAAGKEVGAAESDVYMLWGEDLENTRERINEMKQLAAGYNRNLSYSLSFQVVLGDTEEEAFANAERLISKIDPSRLVHKHNAAHKGESEGVRRLYERMEESRNNQFRIGPNLWAGLAQVLPGNSISLVGTAEQVSDRIVEFVELGFDKVLLRGFPHLETIREVGAQVIPKVRQKLAQKQVIHQV